MAGAAEQINKPGDSVTLKKNPVIFRMLSVMKTEAMREHRQDKQASPSA